MARHRSPGGQHNDPALDKALERAEPGTRTSHRLPAPSSAARGRVVVAAVALGAFAAAAAGQTLQASGQPGEEFAPLAGSTDASASFGMGSGAQSVPDVLTATTMDSGSLEAQKMLASEKSMQVRAKRAAVQKAKEEEARRPKFAKPADGILTSSFGARWGTTHYGLDIANRIGTPIRAVADGVVIEAGPASGFGLWVRIEHADGSVSVYGHVDSYSVREGERVKAGEQIARMGNRGYSTGPHLHFEIWDADGRKVNPRPWLAEHGIKY